MVGVGSPADQLMKTAAAAAVAVAVLVAAGPVWLLKGFASLQDLQEK